jgi:hydroxymethylglutaryl-CoA lyase
VSRIRITEVGPRDGLQNQCAVVSTDDKVAFIDLLSVSGVAEVEVSSFVSPRWVPQLGDAETVFARIRRVPGVVYSALVPNEQGLARALEAKVDKVSHFTAASNTFSRANANASIDETFERLRPVMEQAKAAGLPVHAYISCVVACPYEGPTDPRQVRDVAARLLDAGVDEIDLGETIGVAGPDDIERLYAGLDGILSPGETSLHLHDTRGTALACALKAMQLGVVRFDATCGGLGGCPYAPGAPGNVATEDLVYLCGRMGHDTGVDLEALFAATRHISRVLGRTLPGRVFTADDRGPSAAPPARG